MTCWTFCLIILLLIVNSEGKTTVAKNEAEESTTEKEDATTTTQDSSQTSVKSEDSTQATTVKDDGSKGDDSKCVPCSEMFCEEPKMGTGPPNGEASTTERSQQNTGSTNADSTQQTETTNTGKTTPKSQEETTAQKEGEEEEGEEEEASTTTEAAKAKKKRINPRRRKKRMVGGQDDEEEEEGEGEEEETTTAGTEKTTTDSDTSETTTESKGDDDDTTTKKTDTTTSGSVEAGTTEEGSRARMGPESKICKPCNCSTEQTANIVGDSCYLGKSREFLKTLGLKSCQEEKSLMDDFNKGLGNTAFIVRIEEQELNEWIFGLEFGDDLRVTFNFGPDPGKVEFNENNNNNDNGNDTLENKMGVEVEGALFVKMARIGASEESEINYQLKNLEQFKESTRILLRITMLLADDKDSSRYMMTIGNLRFMSPKGAKKEITTFTPYCERQGASSGNGSSVDVKPCKIIKFGPVLSKLTHSDRFIQRSAYNRRCLGPCRRSSNGMFFACPSFSWFMHQKGDKDEDKWFDWDVCGMRECSKEEGKNCTFYSSHGFVCKDDCKEDEDFGQQKPGGATPWSCQIDKDKPSTLQNPESILCGDDADKESGKCNSEDVRDYCTPQDKFPSSFWAKYDVHSTTTMLPLLSTTTSQKSTVKDEEEEEDSSTTTTKTTTTKDEEGEDTTTKSSGDDEDDETTTETTEKTTTVADET